MNIPYMIGLRLTEVIGDEFDGNCYVDDHIAMPTPENAKFEAECKVGAYIYMTTKKGGYLAGVITKVFPDKSSYDISVALGELDNPPQLH